MYLLTSGGRFIIRAQTDVGEPFEFASSFAGKGKDQSPFSSGDFGGRQNVR
jgi:hypothetical protein